MYMFYNMIVKFVIAILFGKIDALAMSVKISLGVQLLLICIIQMAIV